LEIIDIVRIKLEELKPRTIKYLDFSWWC